MTKGYLAKFKDKKIIFKVVNSFPDVKLKKIRSFGNR